jgi:hypothetical protein
VRKALDKVEKKIEKTTKKIQTDAQNTEKNTESNNITETKKKSFALFKSPSKFEPISAIKKVGLPSPI